MISDQSLYQAFLEGDIKSFEELVIRHRYNLVYFIMQFLNSYHSSEDVAQEVFAYIYVNPERYDSQYEFRTYLFMLGKRRAIDYIRRNHRHQHEELEAIDRKDAMDLEDQVLGRLGESHVIQMIHRLKPDYKKVITLMHVNELTLEETAAIMDKSPGSVKVLAHRARKKLKEILGKGGDYHEIS